MISQLIGETLNASLYRVSFSLKSRRKIGFDHYSVIDVIEYVLILVSDVIS